MPSPATVAAVVSPKIEKPETTLVLPISMVIVSLPIAPIIVALSKVLIPSEVKESFPKEFAIYDLNEFLSALSLFGNPDLDFQENHVVITEDKTKSRSLKYFYSDPSVIVSPSKDVQMPKSEVSFEFKQRFCINIDNMQVNITMI